MGLYLPPIHTVSPHRAVVGPLGAGETIFGPPQGVHVCIKEGVLLFQAKERFRVLHSVHYLRMGRRGREGGGEEEGGKGREGERRREGEGGREGGGGREGEGSICRNRVQRLLVSPTRVS